MLSYDEKLTFYSRVIKTEHDKLKQRVEDDINLGFLLVDFLESNGFEVKLLRLQKNALKNPGR